MKTKEDAAIEGGGENSNPGCRAKRLLAELMLPWQPP